MGFPVYDYRTDIRNVLVTPQIPLAVPKNGTWTECPTPQPRLRA